MSTHSMFVYLSQYKNKYSCRYRCTVALTVHSQYTWQLKARQRHRLPICRGTCLSNPNYSETTIAQICCLCQKLARVFILWMVGCGETCGCNQVYVLNILRSCAPDVVPQDKYSSEQASQQMKMSHFLILSLIPPSLPSPHLQFSHPQSCSLERGSAQELGQQGRSETSRGDAASMWIMEI